MLHRLYALLLCLGGATAFFGECRSDIEPTLNTTNSYCSGTKKTVVFKPRNFDITPYAVAGTDIKFDLAR
jgi:hypothetical protein